MTVGTKIQIRRDTAAAWTSANPVLDQGELALESDTKRLKMGDGTTAWTALAYQGANAYVTVVEHGATAATARPLSAIRVFWRGTVAPTNAVQYDRWVNTTSAPYVESIFNGTTWDVFGSGTYATFGTSVGASRQKVKNLIQPVLLIDKQFPTLEANHQVVQVDSTTGAMWALGTDGGLRNSTTDTPAWGGVKARSGTDLFAARGLFLKLASGALLQGVTDSAGANLRLQRSTAASAGAAFTTVYTFPANVLFLGPQSVAQDPVTGYLYMPTYVTTDTTTAPTFDIMRSTDDGVTWTAFKTLPRAGAGAIRHGHSAQWDSVSARMYFMLGDGESSAGLYRVTADGLDIEAILTNAQTAAQGFSGAAAGYGVTTMFFPNYIAWGVDGTSTSYVQRFPRAQIGQAGGPTVSRGPQINSTGWWSQKAAADGSVWVLSASNENSGNGTPLDASVHLYRVADDGATVDEVAAFAAEGQGTNISSLSPIGGPESGGDVFWLRAHNVRRLPFPANDSAFQIKCRLGWGSVPAISKNPGRTPWVMPKTRGGVAALAASQTTVVGTDRSPNAGPSGGMVKLYLFDVSVYASVGPGTAKIQIWNASAGSLVAEFTSRAYRSLSNEEGAGHVAAYTLPASNNIDIRLVETSGTGTATVSGHVDYAWGNI